VDGRRVAVAPRRPHLVCAVAAAATAVLLTGVPASADPSPTPPPNDLQATVQEQSDAVRRARAELTVTTHAASVALEAYSLAVQAQQQARAEQQRRQNALGQVERALASRRAELGRWARQAYYGGSGLASNPTLTALLSDRPTDDVSHSQRWLAIAGDARGQAVAGFEVAVAAQEEAARAAEQATAASESALLAAQAAKQTRDDAVQEQRVTLARLRSRLQTTIDAAAEADRRARLLAEARDIVTTQRGRAGDNRCR